MLQASKSKRAMIELGQRVNARTFPPITSVNIAEVLRSYVVFIEEAGGEIYSGEQDRITAAVKFLLEPATESELERGAQLLARVDCEDAAASN